MRLHASLLSTLASLALALPMAAFFTALLRYMPHAPMLALALAVTLSLALRAEAKEPTTTLGALR